ncbi:MAG: ATP-binding cassette domain-containing protein, partial [Deltaproteobacteria bacterium]|nr:ATP-binding cassette domain-containing protein [Deltaproteobacteria bacterium]
MSAPVITLDRVTKRYGPVLALNDVTLDILPGITGLVGPNGAGKTTFLRLVTGLLRPSSGRARVLGGDVQAEPRIRAALGYCPDGERVWDWMDGRTFVATLGTWSGLALGEARTRADALLRELELGEAAGR